ISDGSHAVVGPEAATLIRVPVVSPLVDQHSKLRHGSSWPTSPNGSRLSCGTTRRRSETQHTPKLARAQTDASTVQTAPSRQALVRRHGASRSAAHRCSTGGRRKLFGETTPAPRLLVTFAKPHLLRQRARGSGIVYHMPQRSQTH